MLAADIYPKWRGLIGRNWITGPVPGSHVSMTSTGIDDRRSRQPSPIMHWGKRRVLPARFSRLSINSQRWIRPFLAFNSSAATLSRVNRALSRASATVYDLVSVLIARSFDSERMAEQQPLRLIFPLVFSTYKSGPGSSYEILFASSY